MNVTDLQVVQELGHLRGAYKAADSQGLQWFAKPPHPGAPGRLKWAEVTVSAMARALGLRWPLAIPHKFDHGYGVLVAWIDGLSQVVAHDGTLPPDWNTRLDKSQNLEQLSGFTAFSRWADAGDLKNDVLQIDPAGKFWFLDGEYYLGNQTITEWKFGTSASRGDAFNGFDFANALAGRPVALFTPWLDKLPELTSVFEQTCGSVPQEWLPADIQDLRRGLFGDFEWSHFRGVFEGYVKDESGENRW